MPGLLTTAEATAQVAAAHDKYMTGATGLEVQDDLDARVALADATHTTVTNANLHTLDHPYLGGRKVTVAANRAGVDAYPEDTQNTEDLEHEVLVEDALDADDLFSTGGQIGDYVDSSSVSPYVDMMWLAEASKITGEKLF